jgi:hypothetical protein
VILKRDVNAWLYPITPGAPYNDPANIQSLADIALHLVNDGTEPYVDIDAQPHHVARTEFGSVQKSSDAGVPVGEFPEFQLFTPRGVNANEDGFRALSELHQVSIYAHTCQDHQLKDLTKWSTFSEKLANAVAYDFADAPGSTVVNPYIGVLDPTRYLPGDDIATIPGLGPDLPDSLRIPLALRVFDVFDALPRRKSGRGRGDLQMGRININTAPPEVLMLLPFVAPEFNVDDGGVVLPLETSVFPEEMERVAAIMAYRGETTSLIAPFNLSFDEPNEITELTRNAGGPFMLRESPVTASFTKNRSYGFASIGELATLHQFDSAGAVPDPVTKGSGVFDGFMSIGADGIHSPVTNVPTDPHPFDLTPHEITEYNPSDDPEERLAMFRALSNIVTQRSDVYIAWFVLRGYSPDVIEQIPTDGNSSVDIENAMNLPEFRPAYETRWLAVLDRSNVRTPLDRPELLMLVELPNTSP